MFNLHEAHGISQYATAPPGLCAPAPLAEAGAVSLEEEAASPELEATGAHKLVMDVLTSWDANEASLSVGGASLIVPAALLVAAAVSLVEDRASASGAHVSSMVCVARQDSGRVCVSERTQAPRCVGQVSDAMPETSTCKVCMRRELRLRPTFSQLAR